MSTRLTLVALGIALLTACGGDCLSKGERLDCPDGSSGYGRVTADHKKADGWLYALADLASWDFGDTYQTAGSCELACVPDHLGTTADLAICDQLEPCGGDVIGDWRWQVGCPYDHPITESEGCATGAQANQWLIDGTLTFDLDGTWVLNSSRILHDIVVINPPECSISLTTCEDMNLGSCDGEPATGCSCVVEAEEGALTLNGTWTLDGTTLTMVDLIGGGTTTSEVCAEGDTLVMDTPINAFNRREYFIRWDN